MVSALRTFIPSLLGLALLGILFLVAPGDSRPPVAADRAAAAPSSSVLAAGTPATSAAASLPSRPAPILAAVPATGGAAGPLIVKSVLGIEGWLRPGEYAWNDDGVPAGETVIVVNLRNRLLSVYRGGYEIGRSSIIYGADDKPTPTGTFPIIEKDADHVSNLYGAPMPYMLRLTMDGIAIHGSDVEDDSATHGCVGVPVEFAEMLFAATALGDRVIVESGLGEVPARGA